MADFYLKSIFQLISFVAIICFSAWILFRLILAFSGWQYEQMLVNNCYGGRIVEEEIQQCQIYWQSKTLSYKLLGIKPEYTN